MRTKPKRPPQPIVVGVLERSGSFLLCRRPEASHLGGTWEFPGGKVRPGESLEEALRREVEEEVGVRVVETALVHVEEFSYADRSVALHFFLCPGAEGEPEAREGQEARWVGLVELERLEVPAANRRFIRMLEEQYG